MESCPLNNKEKITPDAFIDFAIISVNVVTHVSKPITVIKLLQILRFMAISYFERTMLKNLHILFTSS